jgi:hypothetical protein
MEIDESWTTHTVYEDDPIDCYVLYRPVLRLLFVHRRDKTTTIKLSRWGLFKFGLRCMLTSMKGRKK